MQVISWRCDGCGASTETHGNPYKRLRVLIEAAHPGTQLAEDPGGMPNKMVENLFRASPVDVCDLCKERLFKAVDVANWGKADAASQ